MTPHLTLSLSNSSIQFYQHKSVNVSDINDFKVSDMQKKKRKKKEGGILIKTCLSIIKYVIMPFKASLKCINT